MLELLIDDKLGREEEEDIRQSICGAEARAPHPRGDSSARTLAHDLAAESEREKLGGAICLGLGGERERNARSSSSSCMRRLARVWKLFLLTSSTLITSIRA